MLVKFEQNRTVQTTWNFELFNTHTHTHTHTHKKKKKNTRFFFISILTQVDAILEDASVAEIIV